MIFWIVLPIVFYFFKINLIFIILILTLLDFFRGKSLLHKYINPKEIITYYDNKGIIRWFPEKEWFWNGLKCIYQYHKFNILIELLSVAYKVFLILCYYEFKFYYFQNEIMFYSLILIISTYIAWIIGEIFELKLILKEEKIKNRETNDIM